MHKKRSHAWTARLVITVLACTLIITGHPSLAAGSGKLEVHFIDVGQGDCTFIQVPGGENILVDTGSPGGGARVRNYLNSLGVATIDHMILTHPHDDHIGGIFNLVSAFNVKKFYDIGFSNFQSRLYGDYLKLARADLSKYSILQRGTELIFGDVTIRVLNPILPPSGNLNDDSAVLRITYGEFSILLAADIGIPGEERILNTGDDLKSQILKAGHHGDNNASSPDFLDATRPELVIISLAKDNKYGQPGEAALRRLKRYGAHVYRTDLNGSITVTSTGKRYSVMTQNFAKTAEEKEGSHQEKN